MAGADLYPFSALIGLGWVAFFLLVGVACRRKIPFCRKWLVPSSMLGGFIGFIATNLGLFSFFGSAAPTFDTMQMLVFHVFNLTFVCVGLNGIGNWGVAKKIIKGTFHTGLTSTGIAQLQISACILVVVGWNFFFGTNLLETAGALCSSGFAGGPGSALSSAKVYEQGGFTGLMSLALAFAGIGYIVALFVGVPLANWLQKKMGKAEGTCLSADCDEAIGIYNESEMPPAGHQHFRVSNVDTMTFQVSLVFFTYLLAYALLKFVALFVSPQVVSMIWGMFAFAFCIPMGIFMREVVIRRVMKCDHLFDSGCHSRIMNVTIDLTAIAALIGIEIMALKEWWGVFVIATIVCTIITVIGLWYCTRRLGDEYYPAEHFLAMFGNLTGTAASGFILMRMVDPEYKSTVPNEIGFQGIVSMMVTIPLMPLVMPYMYGQIFYGTSWTAPLGIALIQGIVFLGITFLPFWHNTTKTPRY